MKTKILEWGLNNKLLVIFGLSTFCLFISTLVLATKKTQTCDNLISTEIYRNGNRKPRTEFTNSNVSYRLPRHVIPNNYKLTLQPNMLDKIFNGKVFITLDVLKPTKSIVLHSNNLTIHSVALKTNNQLDVKVLNTSGSSDTREFLYVNLENEIKKGQYALQIEFKGNLIKGFIGLYASTLKKGGTMVASKFQPTYARQAFPCFDEPDFKATFDITLVKPPSYVALSNMNVISKTIDKDMNTESVTFATSVPMSTYLACFVICDFNFKETEINANGIGNNFKLRSYAQKDQMHKIDFAQDIGKRSTEFYVKYYEVPFPLPKLDMIAIPDYISGATEHWGLITYRETSFLVDEAAASSKNKISVANTIAHELAHMWFGNLVTVKWWDELWLNEGFASYMQVKALNAIEPSWTMLDQFLINSLHPVMVTDAKLSSHPIVQTVATPDQITAIFDSITYQKGSSVLRMLEGFTGAENFRRGVSDYLKKFEFGNTVTQNLLASLKPYFTKENPELNISYIMDTWTRQMGYPLLTVAKGNAPNTFVLTQSRFLLDPESTYANDSPFDYRWFVPVTYTTNKGPHENVLWFPDTSENVELTLTSGESWLKINNNQVGYYRVTYPLDMWDKLIEQLMNKAPQLTISDRAHLLDDVFALADAQVVPYGTALNLTAYLSVEEDFVPWSAAASIFGVLDERLINSVAHDHLQKYVQRLVKPLYDKQSWKKTNIGVIEGLLRTRILSLAAHYQLPDAEAKVRNMFLRWLEAHGTADAALIEPDLRDFVYYYGMKSATPAEWDKLWQIYLREEDAQEQTKLRRALAAPRDSTILRRYLVLAWDEKNVRSQDYLHVLQYISNNPSGGALVWDDVRVRWPQLVERFSLNNRYLGNMVPAITADFNTELKYKEMEAWFAQYPEAGAGESARRRALETVRNNIRWASTHLPNVASWLATRTEL